MNYENEMKFVKEYKLKFGRALRILLDGIYCHGFATQGLCWYQNVSFLIYLPAH
jgi:hypothetical protein